MNFHDILMLRGFVGGGGGSGAGAKTWDDLGYSPTGGDTLTWDGNTEGVVVNTDLGMMGYKLSSNVLTTNDTVGGVVASGTYNDVGYSVNIAADDISYNEDGYARIDIMVANGVYRTLFCVPQDNYIDPTFVEYGVEIIYPTAGIWTADADFTISLTIPGYTGFPSVNKVPEKYLPEDYIKGLITEELGVIENGTY